VSNVTDMRNMFYGAKAFNQPIDNWRLFTPLLESTGINLLKLGDKLLYQKFSDKLNKQHFLTEYYRKNDNKIPNSTGVICYSDLRQKTIDLLIKNKNLRICLESMTNSYSYVPITTTTAFDIEFDAFSTPIPEEYICEIAIKKALSDEYGSFGELSNPITFGRKITPEDILNLQKTSMFISVFQDVTGWFIGLINEFDKDDIETLKEILDDYSIPWNSPINMNILYENFSDKGDLECYHIDVGGLQPNSGVEFIGYTIDSDIGITSEEMMIDNMNWRSNSDLFFYNKP